MLKWLAIVAALGTVLIGWPCVAQIQLGKSHAVAQSLNNRQKSIKLSGPVVKQAISVPCSQDNPCYIQSSTPEKPLPRPIRPEWVIVYITAIYAFIAWLTLHSIKRQADTMERQVTAARDSAAQAASDSAATLAAIKRQADLMQRQIDDVRDRERVRLSIELMPIVFNPLYPSSDRVILHSVDWKVRIFGQTDAFDVESRMLACVGNPIEHSYFKCGWGGPNLPSILSPSEKEYTGSLVMNPFSSTGENIFNVMAESVMDGSVTLGCAGHIQFIDVYKDKWIVPFNKKWVSFGAINDGDPLLKPTAGRPYGYWRDEEKSEQHKSNWDTI
jgi:hypothetical protein